MSQPQTEFSIELESDPIAELRDVCASMDVRRDATVDALYKLPRVQREWALEHFRAMDTAALRLAMVLEEVRP